jgi:zinc D-Ala-D-Ala carboxypeptidase
MENKMKLSKNFVLAEFTKSNTAKKKGIDNTPQGEHMTNLKYIVENVLQVVREHFGKPVKINSGYRSPALNKAVGGSSKSQHCNGQAVDFEIMGVPNLELADWIGDNLEFDQLILEFYNPEEGENSGWVHCSLKEEGDNRKQRLIAYKDGKKTRYEAVKDYIEDN